MSGLCAGFAKIWAEDHTVVVTQWIPPLLPEAFEKPRHAWRGGKMPGEGFYLVRFPNCIAYQNRGWGPWLVFTTQGRVQDKRGRDRQNYLGRVRSKNCLFFSSVIIQETTNISEIHDLDIYGFWCTCFLKTSAGTEVYRIQNYNITNWRQFSLTSDRRPANDRVRLRHRFAFHHSEEPLKIW